MHVSIGKFRYPLSEKIIEAGRQFGLPVHENDLNRGEDLEGVGYYCHNNIKGGKRQSASVAFLSRPNLHILTHVNVDRVLFENGRATGVEGRVDGQSRQFRTTGEVIISAGAVHSPKLLQLSGIGPADHLRSLGIEVIHDGPDVGARLREHLGFTGTFRLTGEAGINHCFYGLGLAKSAAQYLAFGSGPLATGPFEVGIFTRSVPDEPTPDLQFYFGGITFVAPEDTNEPASLAAVERAPGLTASASLNHIESEGYVRITSADPNASLTIAPNYVSTANDQRRAIGAVHKMRQITAQPALASYIDRELFPRREVRSDEQILNVVRQKATCGTHAVRSCRVGRDSQSVVDEHARVRGVRGLRVVDCSIIPGLVSENTNAPAMAVGWRASDLILDARRQNG